MKSPNVEKVNVLFVVDGPSDLAGIERRRDLVVQLPAWNCLRQEVVLALLGIESAEEPKFVFDDWAADVDTSVYFREAIGRRTGERKLLDFSRPSPWCVK